jgi:hypothetical protein
LITSLIRKALLAAGAIAGLDDGDWVKFSDVDLTGKTAVVAAVQAAVGGSLFEVRLDALTGPLVATLPLNPSGDPISGAYVEKVAALVPTSGIHSLYFVARGSTNMGSLEWFALREAVCPNAEQALLAGRELHSSLPCGAARGSHGMPAAVPGGSTTLERQRLHRSMPRR